MHVLQGNALSPLQLEDFGRSLLDSEADIPAGVIGPDGKAAPKRFSVYRNNVMVSLIEALEQNFPAVMKMLGPGYFKALSKLYVETHPPQSPVMMWFGSSFPDFIDTFEPLALYPYLGDLARFEWAWLQAYHAKDAEIFDPGVLSDLGADALAELTFDLHPSVRIVQSKWPVLSLAEANRFGTRSVDSIEIEGGEDVLISRPALDVIVFRLKPGAASFLIGIAEGLSLGEAAAQAESLNEMFDLGAVLRDSFEAGAFIKVSM
ncbi:MAG: putative DNA-binding domain-containing protein [Rhodobacteraceae bacterium]|nr:putative DNA-binding domain-containing protein [Paracoccaceae bacterium]